MKTDYAIDTCKINEVDAGTFYKEGVHGWHKSYPV